MVDVSSGKNNITIKVENTNKTNSITTTPSVYNNSISATADTAQYWSKQSRLSADNSKESALESKHYAELANSYIDGFEGVVSNNTNNIIATSNDYINQITGTANTALTDIETAKVDAVDNITTVKSESIASVEAKGNEASTLIDAGIANINNTVNDGIDNINTFKNDSLQEIETKTDDIIADIQENGRALPMFTPIWSDHILNDASYLRADTFSWHNGDIYTTAYNVLLNEFNSDKSIEELEGNVTYKRTPSGFKIADIAQHENILTTFTMTGKSWFYVLDTAQQRFKLPRTQYSFTGIRDTVGGDVKAGLPSLSLNSTGAHTHTRGTMNITGNFIGGKTDSSATDTQEQTGVFKIDKTVATYQGGNGPMACYSFDASRSWTGATSSAGAHSHTITDSAGVLGKSNTVQTPATQMYLYFFIGNYARPQTDIDIGELVEIVNNRDFEGQVSDGKAELNATKNNCIKEINSTGVSGRVLKTGDVMSGVLHIKGQLGTPIVFTNMNVTDGTIPATSNMYYGIQFNDAKGNRIGKLEGAWYTDGTTSFGLNTNRIVDGTAKYCAITCKVDKQGNQVTSAPTPVTGDNSTKIATTAYCVNRRCTTKATTTSSASITRPCWVVQNYVSGTSWYRVWSDGWIEQGGHYTNTNSGLNNSQSITLLKPFANTDYLLQITYHQPNQSANVSFRENGFKAKSTDSFTFGTQSTSYSLGADWYACGY